MPESETSAMDRVNLKGNLKRKGGVEILAEICLLKFWCDLKPQGCLPPALCPYQVRVIGGLPK